MQWMELIATVCKKNQKLINYQLNPGHISLPPEVLLVLGSHGGDHVVRVHGDVHHRVEECNHDALLTCKT
jgi:hypothetical protein